MTRRFTELGTALPAVVLDSILSTARAPDHTVTGARSVRSDTPHPADGATVHPSETPLRIPDPPRVSPDTRDLPLRPGTLGSLEGRLTHDLGEPADPPAAVDTKRRSRSLR